MFKVAQFIFQMGRKQAYTEVISDLETLAIQLPRNREGQLLRRPIDEKIKEIRAKYLVEEGKKK